MSKIEIRKKIDISYKEDGVHLPAAVINTTEEAANYVRQFFHDDICLYESCFVLFLDKYNNTIAYHKASHGSRYLHLLDLQLMTKLAINLSAKQIVLVHNHPTFFSGPNASDGDVELTKELKQNLDAVDIILRDHLVLKKDSYYSFYNQRGSFLRENSLNEKRLRRIKAKELQPRVELCKEIKWRIVSRDDNFPMVNIRKAEDVISFIRKNFKKEIEKIELYFILCLDENKKLISYQILNKNLNPGLYCDSLKVARNVIETLSSIFYVVHSYPFEGEAKCTEVDGDFFYNLELRVELMDYVITDYIILTKDNSFSYDG